MKMSELIGDEMLLSLWPDQFLNKPPALDWPLKDQQIVPVPVVLLDDGRFAFKSDNGQICLVDGLQGPNDVGCQNLPPSLEDPTAELPPLSDATIKSLLVQDNLGLDSELGLPDVSEVIDGPAPGSPLAVDDDLNPLVSFRCQFCSFSSADVPSLMEHSQTHEQPEQVDEETITPEEDVADSSLTQGSLPDAEQFVYYLCSECKEGFTSLTECRDHMIIDHKMVLDEEKAKEVDPETVSVENEVTDTATKDEVDIVTEIKIETDEEDILPEDDPPSSPKSPKGPTFEDLLLAKLPKPRTKPKEDYDPEFEAKPHKCPETMCVCRFSTLNFLQIHQSCHAEESVRSFCCCKCSMLFSKWSACALHLWKDHSVDVDLYSCNVCGDYKTTTRRKLECHKKIHSDERPYKCKVCDKGFKQPTQLINHVSSVHNKHQSKNSGSKWYMSQKCEICLKTYADSKCLKKHMQAVHSKLKPYKCQICGHMSARKAMLQVHIRQHTGEKPFACTICSFRTGDHNSLRRHMMRHSGDKPYKCPHCSYSSIQSSSYKMHLQARHPGLSGSFICKLCHFTTVSKDSYNKHVNDHKLNLIAPVAHPVALSRNRWPLGSHIDDSDVFPENMAAASLVYSSFGASRCDITASSTSRDGMRQTITISIPPEEADGVGSDDDDTSPCYLQDTGGITIPAEPDSDQPLIGFT
ncbi:zinc finger protein 271-like isoform X2 [Macrosteles quadrilineatus]|uniref:zinc finger protein 271-like isoform X2 n=1 Tax=Macrosteles quadrilineatus TaxID=74068 RepID=UPI0023E138F0|nr:zinc finger protein 271-like isoform X2 [Macrosteles quadrilineatus]